MNTGFPSRPNGWLAPEPSKAEGLRPVDADDGKPTDFAAALALLAGMVAGHTDAVPPKAGEPSPTQRTVGAPSTPAEAPSLAAAEASTPAIKGNTADTDPNETPTLELPAWLAPVELGESVAFSGNSSTTAASALELETDAQVASPRMENILGKKLPARDLALSTGATAPEIAGATDGSETHDPGSAMKGAPEPQTVALDSAATVPAMAVGSDISSAIVAALAERRPEHARATPHLVSEANAAPSPEPVTHRQVEVINDIRRAHFGKDTADIVVGEGDNRVDLSITAQGQHVRVNGVTASPEAAVHLRDHVAELSRSLARHGLELDTMTFDFGTGGSGGEPRSSDTQPSRDGKPTKQLNSVNEAEDQTTLASTRDLRAIA